MSLRWRIAAGLAAIAALVGAIGAAGAYLTTSRQLHDSVDDSLRDRAHEPFVRREHDEDDGFCPPPDEGGLANAVQLVSPDGEVFVCYDGAPELPVSATDRRLARDGGDPQLRTVTIDDERLRMITVPLSGGGALQTARSLSETEEVLEALLLRLVALGLAATATAAVLGWFFAGRLVRPVERLRDAAQRIADTQELETPVPRDGPGEIGSLAASFSTMVDALATSRRQQRRLITDASHELRTPLTSLRTNAELVDRSEQLTPDEREAVARGIVLEVDELTNLVAELVELATEPTEDETPEPIHLAEVAETVAERARRRTGRTVSVHEDPDAEATTTGRPQALERAVANLVDNALKYSVGPVEIAAGARRVEVRDRGPGIRLVDQPHVFDRFYRSAEARTEPGSGLGLAIVAQIVARHRGRVWAADREGGGAAVGFELPE